MPEMYQVTEWVRLPQTVYRIENVRLEFRLKGVVPDVICTANSHKGAPMELLIEVAVTHRVGQEKKVLIDAMGLACLEIDVRNFGRQGRVSIDELRTMVLHRVEGKHWIAHPDINAQRQTARQALAQRYESILSAQREEQHFELWLESMDDAQLLREYLNLLHLSWQLKPVVNNQGKPCSPGALLDELKSRKFMGLGESVILAKMGLLWTVNAIALGTRDISAVDLLERAMTGSGRIPMKEFASVIGMAITAFQSPMTDAERVKLDRLRETMRLSIQAGEDTFARPSTYDRALGILFPALRDRLASGKSTVKAVNEIRSTKQAEQWRLAREAEQEQERQKAAKALRETLDALFERIEPFFVWLPKNGLTVDTESTINLVQKNMSERDIAYQPDWREMIASAWRAREAKQPLVQWLRTQELDGTWAVEYRLRILEGASMLYNRGY